MKKEVVAYVLAGGKSSRMGQDKGLLLLNGKPMVAHVLDSLKEVAEKITIVSNQAGYEQLDYEVISDEIKDIGPMGGLYTLLHHTQASKNIVVACDTPFVSAELWQILWQNSKNNQAVVFSVQGMIQPLFGIYDQNILPKVKEMMTNQCYKMQKLVADVDLKILPLEDYPSLHIKQLFNINTPQEFQNI